MKLPTQEAMHAALKRIQLKPFLHLLADRAEAKEKAQGPTPPAPSMRELIAACPGDDQLQEWLLTRASYRQIHELVCARNKALSGPVVWTDGDQRIARLLERLDVAHPQREAYLLALDWQEGLWPGPRRAYR